MGKARLSFGESSEIAPKWEKNYFQNASSLLPCAPSDLIVHCAAPFVTQSQKKHQPNPARDRYRIAGIPWFNCGAIKEDKTRHISNRSLIAGRSPPQNTRKLHLADPRQLLDLKSGT